MSESRSIATVASPPGPQDFLSGLGLCGDTVANPPLDGQSGRCGYGPRMPLLVISPWAKQNSVDHSLTDMSSIPKFVQSNWNLPPITGSFSNIAGSLSNLFNFKAHHGDNSMFLLDPITGQPLVAQRG